MGQVALGGAILPDGPPTFYDGGSRFRGMDCKIADGTSRRRKGDLKMYGKFLMAAGAAACGLFPMAAAADPRDDVVAGMMRCAVLTDDRKWLDCYYGAAQPVRAELGLSPAPQAQIKIVSAQPSVAPVPQVVARRAVRTGPPPMPRRSGLIDVFGGSDVVKSTPLRAYDFGKGGAFIVTLPDGQVWQQTEGDAQNSPVHWHDAPEAMRVTIAQGAMHTFNLVVDDETTHHKVQRIK